MLIHMGFFLIVVFILNQLLIKPILRVLDARKDRVEGNRHAAEQADAAAKTMRADYTARIEAAKKESLQLKDSARREADAEEDKIIKAARAKAGDLVAEVKEKIAAEFQDAQAGLRAETEAMGRNIAARILGRQV
jgi:F-type H+-transporting ATPase subunit b